MVPEALLVSSRALIGSRRQASAAVRAARDSGRGLGHTRVDYRQAGAVQVAPQGRRDLSLYLLGTAMAPVTHWFESPTGPGALQGVGEDRSRSSPTPACS